MSREPIYAPEFERAIGSLTRTMEARFDRLEGKIDGYGERLSVVEAQQRADKNKATAKQAGWSAASAAALVTLFEAIRTYFLK